MCAITHMAHLTQILVMIKTKASGPILYPEGLSLKRKSRRIIQPTELVARATAAIIAASAETATTATAIFAGPGFVNV